MIPPMKFPRLNACAPARIAWVLALVPPLLLLAGAVACSSSKVPAEFSRIAAGTRTYTSADLESIGFKVSKRYDIEGLAGATAATYGFWRPPVGDPIDFEFRFYKSHEEAIKYGTAPADEATGDDAVLDVDKAAWKADVPERRTLFRAVGSGSSGIRARYPDYVIRGNLVILCGGATAEHAQANCSSVLSSLDALPAQGG